MAGRCLSCMKEINSRVCPYCGHPVQQINERHQLPVGTMLRGRYQLGKVLGQGGFGITYLAWDELLRMPVAVKEFYPNSIVYRRTTVSYGVECTTDKMIPHFNYSKERFLREARALVEFRNVPEIVDILDFVEENNTAYIVMEYIRGMDLASYISKRGGRLSVEETFRILRPVMEALATVHKAGIVHRDISPDNIILEPTGGAKLLDFGAVRSVDNPDAEKCLTKSTEAILKHGFAPMEQYNSRGSLGPWTDEYAMCATVWYCLTGRIPEEATLRITECLDPDWDQIPGLSQRQRRALEKGFACLPKNRWQDMDALMKELFTEEPEPQERPARTVPGKPERKQPEEKKRKEKLPREKKTREKTPGKPLSGPVKAALISGVLVLVAAAAVVTAVKALGSVRETPPAEEKVTGSSAVVLDRLGQDISIEPVYIATGDTHTLAITEGGRVMAAGDDSVGQCDVEGWTDIVAVSAGTKHSVGLRSDGTVVATGVNFHGQCAVENWRGIVAISAGREHTAALREDGTVVAVGSNQKGQCGVSDWTDIVAISAGDYHTVGLRSDGTVMAAGRNSDSECEVSDWTDIVAVSAGRGVTVGLRSDGTVVATGGMGMELQAAAWQDIVAVSAGVSQVVGLKRDGSVVLVSATAQEQSDADQWQDIVAVSAGGYFSLGLRADGTLVTAGDDTYGQCQVHDWGRMAAP